jgi:hypothetical protein
VAPLTVATHAYATASDSSPGRHDELVAQPDDEQRAEDGADRHAQRNRQDAHPGLQRAVAT